MATILVLVELNTDDEDPSDDLLAPPELLAAIWGFHQLPAEPYIKHVDAYGIADDEANALRRVHA